MADIREDGSERLHYDDPDFRVFFRRNYIPANVVFPDMSIHWHEEVEFIYVLKGRTHYQLNTSFVTMKEGQGIFVNARQLHLIEAADVDCELLCLIFDPMFLGASKTVYDQYVRPVIDNKSVPYVLLTGEEIWHRDVLDMIARIGEKELLHSGNIEALPDGNGVIELPDPDELAVLELVFRLWHILYDNIGWAAAGAENADTCKDDNSDLALIKMMLTYIYNNYGSRITLKDICEAANIGKTKCIELFTEYIHSTPMEFLRSYRTEKSAELLKNTDLQVTDIAYKVGFTDASYYAKCFKNSYKCSPVYYRKVGGHI